MTETSFNNKSYAQLLACFDNYEEYEISMREVSNEKNKTRFYSGPQIQDNSLSYSLS